MWSQMENVGEDLRPDRSGVIFNRAGDDVITARIDEDRETIPLVLGQIESFAREGFSVVVFQGKGFQGYLHPAHTREYVMGVVRDRSELH